MHYMNQVTASAPGKINLQLLVGKPDAKGYHPLYSIFETVDLRETCEASFSPRNHPESGVIPVPNSTSIEIAYTQSGYPISVQTIADLGSEAANRQALEQLGEVAPSNHLAWKAAAALVEKAAALPEYQLLPADSQLNLRITKRIPAAGGMAGGSADAAATLVAVNELLGLRLSLAELEVIARSLGADVPACLNGGTSLGLGYGDHITRLDNRLAEEENASHQWLMVMAKTGLATPAVFQAFDEADGGRPFIPAVKDLPEVLAADDHLVLALAPAEKMAQIMENDLQETAFSLRPDVAEVYAYLQSLDVEKVMLSGSGPTLAVLVREAETVKELVQQINTHPLVQGTLITSGPGLPAMVEKTH
ncbi:4-(cytidine 5'-diphospho)-2-C-methyl-D-erythritol kinase [Gleimia sp. 6138-11-ORH1]|uniref:4-(cytidine 5'-diphospho)-2-C-methyl-D-erythritol kinase n=1 Tax=Gleimia sp. 6138-11-ORH1 TaxID=2973937 RepID=UPI0021670285|nr:4-(cytidine 5'-diphospho)-2-C-methyl-D-erythritol kinase [Gleimia sp. 6138-11-ORH1]MCS4483946.1 4-(cytidine 5'-diphospho)-2-C-methyl-D-erythritol kinase [Gleimia sp. 6138-11-ORH1]